MPRPKRATPEVTPNAVIASAADITASKMNRPRGNGATEWQQEVWYFFDTIGEFRYLCNWKSQACSRARLIITEETPDGDVPVEAGYEVDALDILFGGDSGQSQMLAQTVLHLEVPGETYVVGEPADPEIDDQDGTWRIYSNEELTRKGDGERTVWEVDRGDGKRPLAEDAVVIRLWRSHPRKWVEADSPARAVLPILREIEQLSKHVAATTDSRLAGAGLLLVPTEIQVAVPDGMDPATADPFMAMLTQAMVASMTDRGSAAAVVPVTARVPGELVDKVKHISFSTPFDQATLDLRIEGIRRLALGLDAPPEVLLGQADSNHWSAWQIDEAALKTHIEPALEKVTSGLTQRWLRPAVEAMGGRVNGMRRINFDTSDLRMRPDRSPQAIQLHAIDQLSGDALRRETGFEPGDAPDPGEARTMLLHRLAAGGGGSPDVTLAALRALGIDLAVPDTGAQDSPPGPVGVPAPVEPADNRNLPQAASAVLACAELLVTRAVERANNRCNNRGKTRRPLRPDQLDEALTDAWATAPRVASLLGLDVHLFVQALDNYTREVLVDGTDHQPRRLQLALDKAAGR